MKLLLPEVGANQPWPYGLVGDEKSKFYARQLDGDFFADVKNRRAFSFKLCRKMPWEKQVDADAHLKSCPT